MAEDNVIFVFGSNLAGRHGKGAALYAREHYGAKYGQGIGFQGRSYAIPTKNGRLEILGLAEITNHVKNFLIFAAQNRQYVFKVTEIGCGLAGYSPKQIAPMFRLYGSSGPPTNVILPDAFKKVLYG